MCDSDEQRRLADLVKTERVIKFFDSTDKECPGVVWSIYGAIDTNEIVVGAQAGDLTVWRAAKSELAFPAMADRRFGIDIADSDLASRLSEELWAAEGDRLQAAVKRS